MQSALGLIRLVIVDPSRAKETVKYIDNSYSCTKYWLNEDHVLHEKYDFVYPDTELKKIQFDTIKRHMAYQRFNAQFNGEVFGSPKASKDKCEFDKNGILGATK